MSSKDTLFSTKQTINCRGRVVDFSKPRIMGILNVTPDSFYDGGRYQTEQEILKRAEAILNEGADIIDVGAYSSRPGAVDITAEREKERLVLAFSIIRKVFPDALLSVDTFRAGIAEFMVNEFGVSMINDISAGMMDDHMLVTLGRLKVPYIMMHMQGTPQNMQKYPRYDDVTRDLLAFFTQRIALAREAGIEDIIIDPGFGFGKTQDHNFLLLRELDLFGMLDCVIMVGLSRKSMIYKSLNITSDQALNGTTVLHTLALQNGAKLLRVHDVKEALETVRLFTLYRNASA
ncbi:MAG: dihydropteroate synthase [Bacteroidales bacterium]|nr:dihydropteroate synthase [Bacteroidales bacterium]